MSQGLKWLRYARGGVENELNYAPTAKYPDVPNSHWAMKYVSLTNDYGVRRDKMEDIGNTWLAKSTGTDLITAYNTGIKAKLFANGSSVPGTYVIKTNVTGRDKNNVRYALTSVSDYRGDSGTFYAIVDYDGIIIYCPEGTYNVEVTISVGGRNYTSAYNGVAVKTNEMSKININFE